MLPVVTAEQMRAWDSFTIANEPVSSLGLMERAGAACKDWIRRKGWSKKVFALFCGRGNNGGDGLVMARLLKADYYQAAVYLLPDRGKDSPDFTANLQAWKSVGIIKELTTTDDFPVLNENTLVVDALFGTGLNKPLTGLAASLVEYINESSAHKVISIDMPSGLSSDAAPADKDAIVKADHTLSFQSYKTALLLQGSGPYIGEVEVLDIGLSPAYLPTITVNRWALNEKYLRSIFKPRQAFAHKGTYGHALLLAGSWGKMGAALLAARACLHAGPGLLTCYLPKCGYIIMQTAVPEAMVITDGGEEKITGHPEDLDKYKVIGIGPGLGTDEATQKAVTSLISRFNRPVIIDADGLNCLAKQPQQLGQLRAGSVITPHPKEFDRLFGEHGDDFERLAKAEQKAEDLKIIIVLKSHHTLIATPSGKSYFNTTGNAGMAKGGSGDVLTGIITGLATQNYTTEEAAILGVYLHGLAGDLAAEACSQEAMIPSHIISHMGKAFIRLR